MKKTFIYFFRVLIVLASFDVDAQLSSVEPKEIVLLIGQSNMAGRAELLTSDMQIVKNAFVLDSLNQWSPLKSPLNIHSSIRKIANMQRFNLGYSFAEEIILSETIKPLGLVVNARGGTKIHQWIPGTHYYQEAVRKGSLAKGIEGKIVATLWLQGESNLNDLDENYKNYFKNLKSIIYALRKDLENDEMIFIAAELKMNKPENEVFKKMLSRLNTEVPNAGSVISEGTSTYDGTHYDNKSLKILGKRFAQEFKELYKKLNEKEIIFN
jgi:hypothetical protein